MSSNKLLEVHINQTLKRISQEKTVLCVNDTCQLDYTSQKKKEGKGTLQYKNQRGFLIHPLIAFTPKNVCLGVLDDFVYSRDPTEYGKSKDRKKKPIQEKESYRWLQSYQKVVSYQRQCPETHLVYIADSEADIYDLFLLADKLDKLSLSNNVLIVTESVDHKLFKSARNIPHVGLCEVGYIDPVTLIRHEKVLITVAALKKLEESLS